jgi:hypothetical protein
MLTAWGKKEEPITLLRLLALIEFLTFKNSQGDIPTGEQFENERLLDFHEAEIKVLDASILAQRAHGCTQT